MQQAVVQFIMQHFQTKFRFRNQFESALTVGILHALVQEHAESLLMTRSEIEQMAGIPLNDPRLAREYFPAKSIQILDDALDDLATLSIVVKDPFGQTRLPLFSSIQIDAVCERLSFQLNPAVLPMITQWSLELAKL